jgi:hypothetical protein
VHVVMGVTGLNEYLKKKGNEESVEHVLSGKRVALEAAGWLHASVNVALFRDHARAEMISSHLHDSTRVDEFIVKTIADLFMLRLMPLINPIAGLASYVYVVFEGNFTPKQEGRAGQERSAARAQALAKKDWRKAQTVPDCCVREVMRRVAKLDLAEVVHSPGEGEAQVWYMHGLGNGELDSIFIWWVLLICVLQQGYAYVGQRRLGC